MAKWLCHNGCRSRQSHWATWEDLVRRLRLSATRRGFRPANYPWQRLVWLIRIFRARNPDAIPWWNGCLRHCQEAPRAYCGYRISLWNEMKAGVRANLVLCGQTRKISCDLVLQIWLTMKLNAKFCMSTDKSFRSHNINIGWPPRSGLR